MDVKTYLRGELTKHVEAAKAITDMATEEGRSLTDEERKQVDLRVKSAGDVKQKLADMEANDELRQSIEALGQQVVVPGAGEKAEKPASSFGASFIQSPQMKALRERGTAGNWSTGPIELPYIGSKANETIISTNTDLVPAAYQTGVVDIAKQPLRVADIIPQASTGSSRIRYLKETTATNSAAKVSELGAKPQSVLQFDNADVDVYKVATILYVSDEFLSDVAGMQSYLDGRLGFFVGAKEEDLLLNGGGTTTVSGLFNETSQTQPLAGDTLADAIYKAKTQVRTGSFLEPTHVLAHPTDWENLRLSKDGADNYMNGLGPFVGGGVEPPVWGLSPIVTTAVSQGAMLVGAFNAGSVQMFRRSGITVEMTNSNNDDFESNQLTLRAESRFALVVYRPGAFCEVTGL